MAAPSSIAGFVELVRKSAVVDDKRLDAYLQKLRAGSAYPTEPGKLAGFMVRDALLTQFQAEQLLVGKWRRFTLGKYKILERLGSGGMGDVYLCEHKFMRRRTAIKVLPAARAEDPACLERFYREARAVAALDHPNIVRAYDIDQEDKLHFLVMEYVDGASLQDIVKKHGPMDIRRACHYISQAAIGLQHAYQVAGLVHRDIKPGNLLVDRQGSVKVLDMGLARFFHDEEDVLTKKYDESVLGTADYLAPEQALDSHSVDIRADIYSLGVTFYFLLTGGTPFAEGTVAQKLIWHQVRQPKPIRSLRPEVPPGLATLVEKMMAKDPGDRYQTPAEVVAALASWTQIPIPPPPEKEMPRLSPAALAGSNASSAEINLELPFPQKTSSSRTKAGPGDPGPSQPATMPPLEIQGQGAPSSRTLEDTGWQSWNTMPAAPQAPAPVARPFNGKRQTESRAPAAVAPAPPQDISPWTHLREEGESPTQLPQPLSPPPQAPPQERTFRKNRRLPWIVAAAVTGAAGLVLLLLFFGGRKPPPDQPKTGPAGATLLVTRSDKANSFKTVREALREAKPGDHVQVLDDSLEEQLILDDDTMGKGVTIESGLEGKRVRWTCPADPPDGKFVALASVPGLHLKGFDLDGQDRVEDLVTLTGECPGLILEDLSLQGFRHSALSLVSCVGNRGEQGQVVFKDVRMLTTKPADSALRFNTAPNDTDHSMSSRSVVVSDCRFEGPFQAAVRFAGPVADVQFKGNRIFQPEDGFLYERDSPRYQLFVTIESNVFADVKQNALHFRAWPVPTGQRKCEAVIKNNVFAKTNRLAQVDEEHSPEKNRDCLFPPGENIRDADSKEGNLPIQAVQKPFTVSTDPNNDIIFLRYGAP